MSYLHLVEANEPEDYSKLIDGRDTKIIQADIIDWIIHMKDTLGLSPASINLYTAAVVVLNKSVNTKHSLRTTTLA